MEWTQKVSLFLSDVVIGTFAVLFVSLTMVALGRYFFLLGKRASVRAIRKMPILFPLHSFMEAIHEEFDDGSAQIELGCPLKARKKVDCVCPGCLAGLPSADFELSNKLIVEACFCMACKEWFYVSRRREKKVFFWRVMKHAYGSAKASRLHLSHSRHVLKT